MNKVLLTLASALVVLASGSGPVQASNPAPTTLTWPAGPIVAASSVVGSLAGGGSVDASGQYHYRLPIDVPPGPAGMQPTLSLEYSSNAGNSLLGMGASLSGASSAIGPCPRTLATDGNATGMAFDGADTKCWDGQRLIQVSSTSNTNTVIYRTEQDSFANIVFTSAGANGLGTFAIQTKSGHTLTFSDFPGGAIQTINYVLTTDVDHTGHAVVYTYDVQSPGEYYPLAISYGIQGTKIARTVQFTYKNRLDPIMSYRNGVSFSTKRLLQSIVCSAPAPPPAGTLATTSTIEPSTVAWTYNFTYTTSVTKRSLLNTVSKIGALGGMLLVRQFQWQSGVGPVYAGDSNSGDSSAVPAPADLGPQDPFSSGAASFQVADFSNAGKDDVLTTDAVLHSTPVGGPLLSSATLATNIAQYDQGNLVELALADAQVGDIDGDGFPELTTRVPGLSAWMRYKWNPTLNPPNFGQGVALGITDADSMRIDSNGDVLYIPNPVYFVDLDGDGLLDMVYGRHQNECTSRLWGTPIDCAYTSNVNGTGQVTPPGFSPTLDYVWSVRWNGSGGGGNQAPGTFGPAVEFLATSSQQNADGSTTFGFYGPMTANPQDAFVINNHASGRGALYFGSQWTGYLPAPPASPLTPGSPPVLTLDERYVGVEWDDSIAANGTISNALNTPRTNNDPATMGITVAGGTQSIMADLNGDGLEETIIYDSYSNYNLPNPNNNGQFCIGAWGGGSSNSSVPACLTLPQSYLPATASNTNAACDGSDYSGCLAQFPGALGYYRTMLFDADGDGRDDVFVIGLNGSGVPTGTGMRVYLDATGTLQVQIYDGKTTFVPYLTGDFDGDGQPDVIALNPKNPAGPPLIKTLVTPTVDRVRAVIDTSVFASTPTLETVRYSQTWWPMQTNWPDGADNSPGLTWPGLSLWAPAAFAAFPVAATPTRPVCTFPQQCIRKGMAVAVEHDVYQGDDTGATVHTYYTYGDPRFDAHGRGFLGFGAVDVYTAEAYTETFTAYNNTFPYTGLPQTTIQMTAILPEQFMPGGGVSITPIFTPVTRITRTDYGYTAANSLAPGTNWNPVPNCAAGPCTVTPVAVELSSWDSMEWEQTLTLDTNPSHAPHLYDSMQGNGIPQPANVGSALLRQRSGLLSYDCQDSNNTACYDNLDEAWSSTTGGDSSDVMLSYLPANTTNWFVSELGRRQEWKGPEGTPAALHSAVTERDTGYTYDPASGLLLSQTVEPNNVAPLQATITYGRSATGLVTSITASTPGQNEPNRVTNIAYDAEGLFPIRVTDPMGHVTQQVTDPALGVPVAASDENGVLTTMTYDEFGRPITVTPTQSATTTMTYAQRPLNGNLNGMTVTVTSGDGSQASTQSDLRGRPVQSQHLMFDGKTWSTSTQSYDGLGRLISWIPPGVTAPGKKRYDTFGRLLEVITPGLGTGDGGGIDTLYDYAVNTPLSLTRTTVTEAQNLAILNVPVPYHIVDRDLDGRIVDTMECNPTPTPPVVCNLGLSQPTGAITTFQYYGSFDELNATTDTNGNSISTNYDAIGRPISVYDPDAGISGVTYDGYGDVVTRVAGGSGIQANGQVTGGVTTTVYHDLLGRTTMTAILPNPATATSYYWDSAPNGTGKLFQSVSPDGVVYQPSYDTAGRTIQESWAVDGTTYTFNRTYDAQGRLTSVMYPQAPGSTDAFFVNYGYTTSGFLQQVFGGYFPVCPARQRCLNPTTPYWTTNTMDAWDHITQGTYGNEIVSNRGYYANTGRVNYLDEVPAMNVSYVYDGEGMLQMKTDGIANNSTETYGYDTLHRLTSSVFKSIATKGGPATTTTAAYTYDVLGNLTQYAENNKTLTTYTYPTKSPQGVAQPHTLIGVSPSSGGTTCLGHSGSLLYDARGRVICDPTRSSTTWTEFDLPKTITSLASPTNSAPTLTTFEYDAQQTRVERTIQTGKIITLGGLFEQRVAGNQTTDVFYVPGPQGMVAQVTLANPSVNSTTTTEYLHSDVKGSTSAVSNAAKGLVQSLYYKPFGQRANVSGQPITSVAGDVQLGFNDLRHDDDIGLIDQHGRVYDPTLRRFLTTDPIKGLMSQRLHPYSYVGNNPINMLDPSGFDGCWSDNSSCDSDFTGDSSDWLDMAGPIGPMVNWLNNLFGSHPTTKIAANKPPTPRTSTPATSITGSQVRTEPSVRDYASAVRYVEPGAALMPIKPPEPKLTLAATPGNLIGTLAAVGVGIATNPAAQQEVEELAEEAPAATEAAVSAIPRLLPATQRLLPTVGDKVMQAWQEAQQWFAAGHQRALDSIPNGWMQNAGNCYFCSQDGNIVRGGLEAGNKFVQMRPDSGLPVFFTNFGQAWTQHWGVLTADGRVIDFDQGGVFDSIGAWVHAITQSQVATQVFDQLPVVGTKF